MHYNHQIFIVLRRKQYLLSISMTFNVSAEYAYKVVFVPTLYCARNTCLLTFFKHNLNSQKTAHQKFQCSSQMSLHNDYDLIQLNVINLKIEKQNIHTSSAHFEHFVYHNTNKFVAQLCIIFI